MFKFFKKKMKEAVIPLPRPLLKISDAAHSKAAKWITEKNPSTKCEWCGKGLWRLGEQYGSIVCIPNNSTEYKNLVMVCDNCGNTKLFNVGIYNEANKASSEEAN